MTTLDPEPPKSPKPSEPPTIWIVNDAGHDYSPVRDLFPDSKLDTLTIGNVHVSQTDRISNTLASTITKFTSKEDFLLLSGSIALNAIALTLWLLHHNDCNFLLFHPRNETYTEHILNREHLSNLLYRKLTSS